MKISTLLLACTGLLATPFSQAADATAPFIVVFTPQAIASSASEAAPSDSDYVRPVVRAAAQALAKRHGFGLEHVYSRAIEGFSAKLNAKQLKALRADARVAYIEQDRPMAVLGVPVQAQGKPAGGATPAAQVLPWGINRVKANTSSTLAGNGSGAVTGVRAYIIDTGIDTGHTDLYVVQHVNFAGGVNKDCHGHGTHVAGTVGAKDNSQDVVGVAPGVALVGVKVLGCGGSGTTSGVIAGVDWVTANATAPINQGQPAVANMSLGGGASQALDTAVLNSAAAGVFYAVAAGNDGADACLGSPARAGAGIDNGVMTTAATDSTDKEASFSNYGSCVDGWAPGVGVLSTKKGGGTTTFSGTSMATPHMAGGAALYLSNHPAASTTQLEAVLGQEAILPGTLSKDARPIELLQVDSF
jgi:subtilisin family serine protease